MPKTLPGYTRYPGDFLMEVVSTCSLAAQGLWTRLEDLMHATERYGYLQHLGKPMPDLMVARRIGISVEEYNTTLSELESVGWIVREPRTKIIYSEALLAQNDKRSGDRERKHKSRLSTSTSDLRPTLEPSETELRFDRESTENFTDSSIYKDSLEDGHNAVTSQSHPMAGKEKEKEREYLTSTCLSPEGPGIPREGDLPPVVPPTRAATQQVSAALRPPEPDWDQGALIEEIAIASPAGVANSWTPLSLHGNSLALSPVVNAVILEAQEQGIPEREAALWLLRQVRQVSEAVMREPGWKRFWTQRRMVGFYTGTEYRDLEKFTTQHGGSNGNGHGNGKRNADPNAEVRRRLLGEPSTAAGAGGDQRDSDPPAGDRLGAAEPGGHAGPGRVETGSAGGVHGGAVVAQPGGVHRGFQPGAGAKPVLPQPSRAQSLRWPS